MPEIKEFNSYLSEKFKLENNSPFIRMYFEGFINFDLNVNLIRSLIYRNIKSTLNDIINLAFNLIEKFKRSEKLQRENCDGGWGIWLYQKSIDLIFVQPPEKNDEKLKKYREASELNSKMKILSIDSKNTKLYMEINRKQEIFTKIGDINIEIGDLVSKNQYLESADLALKHYEDALEAYNKVKFIKGIKSAFEKIKQKRPLSYEIYLKIAEIYCKLGMHDKGALNYNEALWLVPKVPAIQIKIWTSRADFHGRFSENSKKDCENKIKKIKEMWGI